MAIVVAHADVGLLVGGVGVAVQGNVRAWLSFNANRLSVISGAEGTRSLQKLSKITKMFLHDDAHCVTAVHRQLSYPNRILSYPILS